MSKFCRNCGAVLSDSAKVCPNCGDIPRDIVTQKSAPSVGGGNSVPSLDEALNAVMKNQNGQNQQPSKTSKQPKASKPPKPPKVSGDDNNKGVKIAFIIILSVIVIAGGIVLGVLLSGRVVPGDINEPELTEEEQLIQQYMGCFTNNSFDIDNMTYICQYLLDSYTCNPKSYDEITDEANNFSGVYIDYSQYLNGNVWAYEDEDMYLILEEDYHCIAYLYDDIYSFWAIGVDSDAEYAIIDIYNKYNFEDMYYNGQSGIEQLIYDLSNSSLKGFTYNDFTSDGMEYHLYYDGYGNLIGGMLLYNDEFIFFDGSYEYMSEDDGWVMHDDFYNF